MNLIIKHKTNKSIIKHWETNPYSIKTPTITFTILIINRTSTVTLKSKETEILIKNFWWLEKIWKKYDGL